MKYLNLILILIIIKDLKIIYREFSCYAFYVRFSHVGQYYKLCCVIFL